MSVYKTVSGYWYYASSVGGKRRKVCLGRAKPTKAVLERTEMRTGELRACEDKYKKDLFEAKYALWASLPRELRHETMSRVGDILLIAGR